MSTSTPQLRPLGGKEAAGRRAEPVPLPKEGGDRISFRLRILAACVLLVGLALIQDPGYLVPDTKYDLIGDPGGFLARALHLWDAEGAFGQLQNQAYGYLWPMGPFFWLGAGVGLPAWLVQRLWMALVLCVAFTGAASLARAFGVRSDLARITAGFAFALSPRFLTTLGPISIEAWPSAVAPWILLALVTGSTRGSARRYAALAGLGVSVVGGVNAAATFAVIPLGVIWLLTRERGARRRTLMFWWPVFTLLGTLWWLIPLFVMGAYSPPFLDYIETTAVTTFPTNVFDVLRGTSNWVPYVERDSRAGNDLITSSAIIINSGLLITAGLVGLMGRWALHRRFLVTSMAVGILIVGAGHVGVVQGWFASDIRIALDGALAPLRNVHKFDVLVRLPLVMGLAVLLDRLVARRPGRSNPLEQLNRVLLVGIVLLAAAGSMLPAFAGRITPAGGHLGVPDYWTEASEWLANAEGESETSSLLVPGSAFGEYIWGAPQDEPMQYLANSRWAVRNVVPLTPTGTVRMLDGIQQRLAEGRGSAGFADYLRRAGVRHLVVRNDLASGTAPDPVLVHQALHDSPGLTRVATFGPLIGGEASSDSSDGRIVYNGGWKTRYPAVEVYRVGGIVAPAVVGEAQTTVVGGPEDLADLADLGVVGTEPTVLAADRDLADRAVGGGRIVLTDGFADRERNYAKVVDGTSAVFDPGARRRQPNARADYPLGPAAQTGRGDGGDRWRTRAVFEGATTVAASSSASDSNAPGGIDTGALPYAAIDGDPATSWRSGARTGPSWWQVGLDIPRQVSTVRVRAGDDAPDNQMVRVRTERGASDPISLSPGESRSARLPDGVTRWVQVEQAQDANTDLSLSEITIPGVQVHRRLVLPDLPEGWGLPDVVVLRALHDARDGCAEVDGAVRCAPELVATEEEPSSMRREVDLSNAASWRFDLRARPHGGRALDQLALRDQVVDVTTTSVALDDPRAGPLAAVDGDPGTAWLADPDNGRPTIQLRWLGAERVRSIRISLEDGVAARRPTRVSVTSADGTVDVDVSARGVARIPETRTTWLDIAVLESAPAKGVDAAGYPHDLGVGVSELEVEGVPKATIRLSEQKRRYECGTGPSVFVAGTAHQTRLHAAPAALARGDVVAAQLCGGPVVSTAAGRTDIDVRGTAAIAADSLVMTREGGSRSSGPSSPAELSASATTREIDPDSGVEDQVVVLRQNVNAGWEARQGGDALQPVTIDGWQQGWTLANDDLVEAEFAPDRAYRWGLGLGLACLLLLAAIALGTSRRWRGDHAPAVGERAGAPVGVGCCVAVASVLVAGGWGLVVGGAAVVTAGLLRRRPAIRAIVLAAPVFAVAGAYALRPWGSGSGWAGEWPWTVYLPLFAVAGALGSLLWEPRARRPRRWWPRRIPGSSTAR